MTTKQAATLLDIALDAQAHGLAVVPPRQDGSKAPDGTWRHYQTQPPTADQIRSWYTDGSRTGIGILTGQASGNLEMLELEGRAANLWKPFVQACRDNGLGDTIDRIALGYCETTPSGGAHLLYRSTQPVDGNLKLARTLTPDGELQVLIETRGEGGYVVTAPSHGNVHPSGEAWELRSGTWATIATITAEERHRLLEVARSFDQLPAPDPPATPPVPNGTRAALTGDSWMDQTEQAFNQATTWAQILGEHGWQHHHTHGQVDYWTRPGKNPSDGHSATTNATGTDRLIVFSSSVAGFRTADGNGPAPSYTRFGAWAILNHSGDRQAAALHARTLGHGPPLEPHTATTSADLRNLAAPATPGAPWEPPLPLQGTPPPPFPTSALPDWVAQHCHHVANALQVPVDLCGQLALGVLATLAAGHIKVGVRASWTEPVNLYLTTVMPSGAGKSPADRAIVTALRHVEAKLLQLHAKTRAEAEVRKQIADRKAKKALEAAARGDTDPRDAIAAQAAADNIQIPAEPRLLARDATPEVLAQLLHDHGGRIAIVSTEAELYDIVLGTYGNRVNLAPYLAGWSADELIVDRKGGGGNGPTKIRVPEATLTISITVQPSALEQLRTKPELAGRGFVQRFLYAWPPSLVGTRTWDPDDNGTIPTTADWEQHIEDLGIRLSRWTNPATIPLDTPARHQFFQWRQHLEDQLADHDDERLAEFIAKLTGSVARTSALLHIAHGHPVDQPISAQTLEQAIELGNYWLAHADAVWLQFGASGALADARAVLAWLRRTGTRTFRRRDVYAANRRRFANADLAEAAIVALAEHGWVRPTAEGTKGSTKPNPIWEVHPEVHQ